MSRSVSTHSFYWVIKNKVNVKEQNFLKNRRRERQEKHKHIRGRTEAPNTHQMLN